MGQRYGGPRRGRKGEAAYRGDSQETEERGVDVNDLFLSALSKEDPQGSARLRLELAEKFLAEAEEYVRKEDAVQASEKGYRAAEEVVKAWPRDLTCLSTDRQ